MPNPGRKAEENAKYCSIFFRPWTLLSSSDVDVPHLHHLGVSLATLRTAYTPSQSPKKARTQAEDLGTLRKEDLRQWPRAWEEYIRGEVVSQHCARLIQTFLTNTMARANDGGMKGKLSRPMGDRVGFDSTLGRLSFG